MKALKIVGITLAVIILVGGGAVAYLVSSFDAARIKNELAATVLEKTGRTLKIEGDLSLGFWPDVAVRVGHTTLSERGDAQTFATIDNARVAVAVMPLLSKQVAVKRIELDGLSATVIKRKDGTLNFSDLAAGDEKTPKKVGAGETAPAALPAIDIAGIRIANAKLDWRDEQAGSHLSLADLDLSSGPLHLADGKGAVETFALSARGKRDGDDFTLKFEVPRLNIAPEGASGESLKLSATLDGKDRKLAASLVLTGVAKSVQALKIEKFALDADARMADTHLVAQLASPVAFDLEKRSLALPKLGGKLDVTHPKLPMKTLALPLSGGLQADLAKQTAGLDFVTQLDATHLKARIDIGSFTPLALAFDLDIDQLDLDKYLPPDSKEEKKGDPPIDLAALKGLNLHGTAKIGQLTAAKLKASDIRLKLDARGGKLSIAPLSANLYEGRLDGALSADANGNRIAVQQNLSKVHINPLLKDLLDKDIMEGRGTVALDVAGSGATVGALKKSLGGTARLSLADGAIKGINIGQKLRDAQSLLGGKKDVAVASDATQKTDFSELTASFRIANGVAHNDDLVAKSPLLRLAGAGDIDIGNSRLNYLAKASVVATSTGQGGKELDKVKGITLPVRLTGPFDKPEWKIELASAAEEAVKAKTEAVKQKAEDKLKSKFRGLFNK